MLICRIPLRCAALTLLTVLVVGVCWASAVPQRISSASQNLGFLRFGQSLALADFDGDDRIDTATLNGFGRDKDIEIRLSRLKSRVVLRFNTLTSEQGSLFTRDVDNDGDSDLIWSDLLRPGDVVVWMGDGSGRFDRVSPDRYASVFVLSNAPAFSGSEIPLPDYALGPRYDPLSALPVAQKVDVSVRKPILVRESRWVRINPDLLSTPLDRGPPHI